MAKLYHSARWLYTWRGLPWAILALGALLRMAQYAADRSLWMDEAKLALNIVARSYGELAQPLDYDQGAPLGFLLLTRLAVSLFGPGEYALRLIPLLAGLAALPLFYAVAKRSLQPNAVPLALALFVLSSPLIYYASEVKQYSSDVAVTLALCLAALWFQSKPFTAGRVLIFGLAGAVAIWFSHPAVFVLAGIGVALAIAGRRNLTPGPSPTRRGELTPPSLAGKGAGGLGALALFWGASFLGVYWLSLANLGGNTELTDFWAGGFMPLGPTTAKWLLRAFLGLFNDTLGLTLSGFWGISDDEVQLSLAGIGALALIVGGVVLWRRRRDVLLYTMLPLLATVAASALGKYPFQGRMLLFAAPLLLLLIAAGAASLWFDRNRQAQPSGAVAAALLIGLLFLPYSVYNGYHLVKPKTNEELKPVLAYMQARQQPGDAIYVYHSAQYAMRYYAPRYGLTEEDYVVGVWAREDWDQYLAELQALAGKRRVWVIFSHLFVWQGTDEENVFLHYLDNLGRRLAVYTASGTKYISMTWEGSDRWK